MFCVGRGLDPADPVLVLDWYVEWYYFRNNHEKTTYNSIYPPWQVSLPERRGQDPALRKLSFRLNGLVGEALSLPPGYESECLDECHAVLPYDLSDPVSKPKES